MSEPVALLIAARVAGAERVLRRCRVRLDLGAPYPDRATRGRGHRTCGRDHRPPIGAAWSASVVPASWPTPGLATAVHQYSPASPSLAVPSLPESAGPLRHVRSFPALGLLRVLRPNPRPSADDAPSESTRLEGEAIRSTGVVPTFTVIRSSGEAASFAPAASPWLRRSPSPWPPDRRNQSDPGVPAQGRCAPRSSPDPPGSS